MATENSNPSVNPANLGTLTGTFRHIFGKLLQRVDNILPAVVIAFNRESNPPRVQVQPAINVVGTDGSQVARAQIDNLPVIRLGGGGYFIDFNLTPGDAGLLFACDRDISLFLQNGSASKPNTFRVKNFSDSFFLPCIIKNAEINAEDMENAVLQNLDGSIRLSLWQNKIKVTAPLFAVDGEIIATGNITSNTPIPP